jgi:hypothetical protein
MHAQRLIYVNPHHPDARKLKKAKQHPVIWDERLVLRR